MKMLQSFAIVLTLLVSAGESEATTVEEVTFSRSGFVSTESDYTYCDLSATYPRVRLESPKLSDRLNERIERDVMERIGSCPEGKLLSQEGVSVDEIRGCTIAEESCEITYISDAFASLKCTTTWPSESFCGTKPSANVHNVLYALHDGVVKRVQAEDIFVDHDAVSKILEILEDELEIQRTESWNAISIEEVPEVATELLQNMAITEEALEFRVMPRHGCYYEVSISLNQISSLVRREYWPWRETAN